MRQIFGWLTLCLFSSVHAADLAVDYSSFYSHLKKVEDEETADLEFLFGFKFVQGDGLCHIDGVQLVTQKQTMDVDVTASQRFRLPTERALKLAQAKVLISLQEPANQCDMSIQLQTKPAVLSQQYEISDLSAISAQFATFFDNMGSFLSFLMPTNQGIVLHFNDSTPVQVWVDEALVQLQLNKPGELYLDNDWLQKSGNVRFSSMPYQITPWMED